MKAGTFHPSAFAISKRWLPASKSGAKSQLEKLLAKADIRCDGRRSWDLRVHHPQFYRRVLAEGSLGLGESYMEGWWDCERLDEMVCRASRAGVDRALGSWGLLWEIAKARLLNAQRKSRAISNAERHYEIGEDLYEAMLGPEKIYSCAYWRGAKNLKEAQRRKLELCCRKLSLKPGMKVLDIGCGWGALPAHMAKKYGVRVVGITAAQGQYKGAKRATEGLDVEIRLQDYRDLPEEKFDRIVSVGMFEHVGYKNYRHYMEVAARRLNPDGLFLLHTIGGNRSMSHIDPWIQRHVFPNAVIPSIRQVGEATEGLFVMEDWHNFGPDYDRTLMAWHENFQRHWPELKHRYSKMFRRKWEFYLLSCAGAFRARELQLWQVLLSKGHSRGRRTS